MILFFIILYLVVDLIVLSLYLMNLIRAEQQRYNFRTISGGDITFFFCGACFVGLAWPISIWIALLVWKVNKNEAVPGWVEDIRDVCLFCTKMFRKGN